MSIEKRDVRVEVGEGDGRRTFIFRLGVNEVIQLQQDWGIKDDQEFLEMMDDPKSLQRVRTRVRRALLANHPNTTEEEAGDLITELGVVRMKEIMNEVVRWALPEKEPAGASTPGKAEAASPGATPS